MTDRKLMQQALDVLTCSGEDDDPGHRCTHCDDYVDRNGPLRAALRDRLAQPERDELQAKGEHPAPCARHCEANAFQIVIKNLKAELAQSGREPVDVGQLEYSGYSVAHIYQKMTAYRNSIDASWDALRSKGIHPDGNTSVADAIAKYTASTQRTWVGLTDEEKAEIWSLHETAMVVTATEAKLKEKNT